MWVAASTLIETYLRNRVVECGIIRVNQKYYVKEAYLTKDVGTYQIHIIHLKK